MNDARQSKGPGFMPPLIGPAAWDVLARAAGGAEKLVTLIRSAPDEKDIMPTPKHGTTLTVEDVEAAPPASLARLIRGLKFEVDEFEAGREFNSGLSLHPGGLEVREVRPMLADKKTGRALHQDKAVLVLDATPMLPLYEHLAQGLVLETVYAPEVELPVNVTVIQIADRFFGKGVVERHQQGSEERPGRDALMASLETQRRRFPGVREAAICAKALKPDVVAAGIEAERVLTYFGSRGRNSIEDADVLHVLGRPQAPDYAALQLAHVLHKGEAPIIPHMAMRPVPYAGYRAQDGSGRAITVSDFYDLRASVIFCAYRESELLQAVHRGRLFRVGSAQVGLFDLGGQPVARTASERRSVRLVIHSAHPVPGLRVDELTYDETPDVNERRAAEAAERILAARDQLMSEGIPITVNALARATGSNKRTVTHVLTDKNFDGARFIPLKERVISRGMNRAGSNFPPSARMFSLSATPRIGVTTGIDPGAGLGSGNHAIDTLASVGQPGGAS